MEEFYLANKYAIRTERMVKRTSFPARDDARAYVSVFSLLELLQKLGVKV